MPQPPKPTCTLEIINPDDILVVGLNNKWFRTFTTSSDRYPLKVTIPAHFLNDGWNLLTGDYSNIALVGKNDANLEYKLQLDGQDVVHVKYVTEVQAEHFRIHFKDTFNSHSRTIDKGEASGRKSKRFTDLMSWQQEQDGPPPG